MKKKKLSHLLTKKLRAAIENHRLRLFILLALSAGLRLGELLALTWEGVYDGMVHVNKSLKHSAIVGADGTKDKCGIGFKQIFVIKSHKITAIVLNI